MDTPVIWLGDTAISLRTLVRGLAILFLLAALPVGYVGWLQEKQLSVMRTEAVEVAATVVSGQDDKRRAHGRERLGKPEYYHTYHLTLRWTAPDGQDLTTTREVSEKLFFRAKGAAPEESISLRYLPGRPDVKPFIPSELNDQFNTPGVGAIGLLVMGLGLAWLAWPPRRAAATMVA